jgi:hypothetical protein
MALHGYSRGCVLGETDIQASGECSLDRTFSEAARVESLERTADGGQESRSGRITNGGRAKGIGPATPSLFCYVVLTRRGRIARGRRYGPSRSAREIGRKPKAALATFILSSRQLPQKSRDATVPPCGTHGLRQYPHFGRLSIAAPDDRHRVGSSRTYREHTSAVKWVYAKFGPVRSAMQRVRIDLHRGQSSPPRLQRPSG